MSEVPEFSNDTTEKQLSNNDPMSNSPVKGGLKWNHRDNEYVFIWWQNPFWIATDNGGYSMTKELLDKIPDHIEQIWVVDDKTHKLKRFDKTQYTENGVEISPDDPRFENVTPDEQVAVDRKDSKETFDLDDADI